MTTDPFVKKTMQRVLRVAPPEQKRMIRAAQGLAEGQIQVTPLFVSLTSNTTGYLVRSTMSGSAKEYVVVAKDGQMACSCPDFERRQPCPCKHIFAVQMTERALPAGP